MTENRKTPKLRFKGFTDAWEQRKLGDLAEIRRGLTYKPGDVKASGIRVLRSSNINEEYFEIYEDDVFVDEVAINIPYVKKGDIIITSANGSSRLVGKHAIIKNIQDNSMVHGGFMLVASADEPEFLNSSMSSPWYTKFINIYVAGGNGAIGNLSKNDLDNQEILVPSIAEQQKIGTYFRTIDNLITLHQRKLERLKNVKKSMLDKMFPKDGEVVPEIRFKGFTDAWEQRKVGDIAEFSKGVGYSKGDLRETGTPIILYGRLYTNYQFFLGEIYTFATPKDGSVYSKGNEVIIPASGETAEDIARASAVEKSGILLGGDLNVLRPFKFINPLFLSLTISNGEPHKNLAKRAQGKSVVHIHNSDIQDVSILFPSRLEQDRIVSVFRKLDNLITLHQRKLDKLKNIKKSMLDNMFV